MPTAGVFPETPLFPPVSEDAVRLAESKLKFTLPPLLRQLFVSVGNVGFGPGYRLFGLEGGHLATEPFAQPEGNLVDAHLANSEDAQIHCWEVNPALLVICDWGCLSGSAIDLPPKTAGLVFLREGDEAPEGLTFQHWMEDWANGVDLWKRAYHRPN